MKIVVCRKGTAMNDDQADAVRQARSGAGDPRGVEGRRDRGPGSGVLGAARSSARPDGWDDGGWVPAPDSRHLERYPARGAVAVPATVEASLPLYPEVSYLQGRTNSCLGQA